MRHIKTTAKLLIGGVLFATSVLTLAQSANALTLAQATRIAVESNPEIGQAIENREATEFELKQALGLYLPRVDLEASVGVRRLDNPSRRSSGIQDDPLYPSEVGVVATYDIYDGGYRQSEANRQAARVDGASFRVLERSEYIGLNIAREYFEILLQTRIVGLAQQNVAFHQTTLGNVRDAVAGSRLTAADENQAVERLAAARATLKQAEEALATAMIGFNKLVGVPLTSPSMPAHVTSLPKSLADAIGQARLNNPRVKIAGADIDAASAVVQQSQSGIGPKISLEGRASTGFDTGGVDGGTTDVQGRVVMRWTIFDGGIKGNEVQENIRRESEAMLALHQAHREVEEAVRISWERMLRQRELSSAFRTQVNAADTLVSAYREQFNVGQRSLLDVLDAQSTRVSVQVQAETAAYASRYAEYRLLAATGRLLSYLGLEAPKQAEAYAREELGTPAADSYQPRARKPVNFDSVLDLAEFVN